MRSYSKNAQPETVDADFPELKRTRDLVEDGELEFAHNSAFPDLRRTARRRLIIELANCGPEKEEEDAHSSAQPASCCSSHASVSLIKDRPAVPDPTRQTESPQLETLTFSGGRCNRSEAIPSGEMESAVEVRTVRDPVTRFKPAVKEMPSKVEIDEFLSAAENDLQKRFSEKYNFDVVNGVPLKGRYEWVRIKP